MTPRIVCLLPARNAADLLPGLLESAPQFCDAVVALDDGSTDDTGSVLRSHDIVHRLLANRRRETAFGWNDGANRNRLLAEAGDLGAEWIVSIDADERVDATDAEALRRFLDTEALAGLAYGFRLFRMVDHERYEPDHSVVHRLFRYQPGQRFPDAQLWCTPVPTSVPAAARVETSLRIQHLGDAGLLGWQRRLARHAEADPQSRFRRPLPPADPAPTRLRSWAPRPADLRVLGTGPAVPERPVSGRPARVVCLLPARNCASELGDWFACVRPLVDAVVALDDGSTDDTADVLEAEPIVEVLLRNPRREGYFAWDDSRNRNRLLEAAADLDPDWVISLDADERIDAADMSALRRFIDEEADPTRAYGFRVYRMIGDTGHYDRIEMVVYRLFAFHEGQVFRDDRLHFYPVPTSVPRGRWQQTTIRIQHLSALTEERRRARWQKYLESDPGNEWDLDYTYALVPPGVVKPWPARPPGLSVVAEGSVPEWDLADLDLDAPQVSVLVLRGPADEGDVLSLLPSLVDGAGEDAAEVLLVDTTDDGTADLVRRLHPDVVVHTLDPRVSDGQARDLGLRAARGDFVLILRPGDSVEPGALGALAAAHDEGAGLVAGTVIAAPRTRAGWAAYFVDHAASLPGGPAGPLEIAPARSSYPLAPLIGLGLGRGLGKLRPADVLVARGFDAARRPGIVFVDDTPGNERTSAFLRARFDRGRAVERTVQGVDSDGRRAARRGLLGTAPRLSRIEQSVAAAPEEVTTAYHGAAPLVRAGLLAMSAGSLYERAAGRASVASGARRRRRVRTSSSSAETVGRSGPVRVLPPAAGMAVALTFDDGPLVGMTDSVLDELAAARVPATFFVVGSFAERHPELVWRAVAEGHSIGVHGWDHTRFSGGGPAQREQLERSLAAVRAAGADAHLFRPPFGTWDTALLAVAASMGLTTVTWSVNPEDWRTPGTAAIVDHVRAKVRPGSVILLHDGRGDRTQTVDAIRPIVDELHARDLAVVDLAAALGAPATLVAPSPPK